ncbi:DUF1800 domain-containing protein [Hymenobacter ginsengisoli]|uniref:DUF1800 domain-containing protein n=1 Tax=Hymenobacter ginsengisoli TaxID=1051626 RepID=A0ABP8QJ79_9BACT|nr:MULTISPECIES: DUF1800 domain-containing protein [unclassified Hymenobacter]MBO2030081.1 DUF1800 domain-containing protein [Hymenobacter sp. BT559]
MNRRALLQPHLLAHRAPAKASAMLAPAGGPGDPPEAISPFANKALPARLSTTASTLAPYAGPWGVAQATHLLRRSLFGPTRGEIQAAASSSLSAVLDKLLTPSAAPSPPLNVSTADTTVPIGQPWVGQAFDQTLEGARRTSLRDWWLGQQLGQGTSLSEKMTLFWHNHFVVEFSTINSAQYGYDYVRLLRQYALGNIRQLAKDMTINPAMLRYLNGNASTAGAPNENYGRELMELFTLGKGPLIGPGNYTTYTEADVQAAAKVLTGWRDDPATVTGYFTASRHDTSTKQFSAAFGNAKIAPNGASEYKDLIDLIFRQSATAAFLVRKLYRWFVYYVIDAQIESDIIQPLASLLVSSNFEVAPVLRALLGSEHFFDMANVGCLIKSPLDFTIGVCRQFELAFPPASSPVAQYGMWDYLYSLAYVQQQTLGDPPNVAGWVAYYQTPQYHELWINAVTLPRRNQATDLFLSTTGYARNGFTLKADLVAWVQALPPATAADPNLVIAEFAQLMVPLDLTANQLAFLKNALIPGLPDFEWTAEWSQFLSAPTNTAKRNAVALKLSAMARALAGLAEYQLS